MSKVCQLTGKKVQSGNNVSFSLRRTRRKFYPNLVTKNFHLPSEDRTIKLKVSTRALRTIDKIGIEAMIKESKAKGLYTGA